MKTERPDKKPPRTVGLGFWIIAVLATALTWAGLSFKQILVVLGF